MKFKKVIIFLLCAIMSLSMLACGNIDLPDNGGGGGGDDNGGGKTWTVRFDVTEPAKNAGVTVFPFTKEVNKGSALGTLPTLSGVYPGHDFQWWEDSSGKQYTNTTPITGDITLKAKWESNASKLEYEKNISDWAKPGHLYIHYKRFDHKASEETTPPAAGVAAGNPEYNTAISSTVYGDWGLWAWPKSNANGRLFNAAWVDESGAVFDVLLDKTYSDCGWDGTKKVSLNVSNTFKDEAEVGVQICQLSTRTDPTAKFWANDGGDNTLIMSQYKRDDGDYHWFVNESRVSTKPGYGSPVFTNAEIPNPYANDPNHTLNGTKTSGANIIANSAADNSGTYPVKNVNDQFNCRNGYQIFIASFADSDGDGMGDIKGIINKLDYLASLSIDLLWLTPFQDSTNYHGYDINDYYNVDSRWGTMDEYRELINKAKGKGIKIVMDFVLNHTSISNEWFVKSQTLVKEQNVTFADKNYAEVDYRQFYSWITKAQYDAIAADDRAHNRTGEAALASHWYKDNYDYYFYSSFGSSMPELNYDYQPVRDAILDVCYKWMEQGLAGFRLDAVKHIYMCNEVKGKNSSVSYNENNEFEKATKSGANLSNPINYDYVADDDSRFDYDIRRNLNWYREFNNRLKTKYPQAFVVGENLDGWDQRTAAFYQGIDSQFDFALYYNLPRGIMKADGVPAGSQGQFGAQLDAIYDRYVRGQQAYTKYNKSGYIGGQFTSNHDLPRARDRMAATGVAEDGDDFGSFYKTSDGKMHYSIDGKTHIYTDDLRNSVTTTGTVNTSAVNASTDRLKVYYAALMTLPGVTWLYYGDELGMSGLMQHTLSCKEYNKKTSSTASDPHEDVIYRQPMKWNKATAAEYNDADHTSHGNAAFKIGYGDILCELVGINATDNIPSVAECSTVNADGSYTFTNGTLIDWVAKLNKMRKLKGINGKSKVTLVSKGTNRTVYKVRGDNGTIQVEFSTSATNGTAYNSLRFDGQNSRLHVLITEA